MRQQDYVLNEATLFIQQCYAELGFPSDEWERRIGMIEKELMQRGTYTHTEQELAYGCKLAWRNSNRCIGRLFWDKLRIRDARQLRTADEVFEVLFSHIKQATNGGKIIPLLTAFAPVSVSGVEPVRILNHQLIRYAGYEVASGTIGDPASIELTRLAMELGWKGGGGAYDILPLLVKTSDEKLMWRDIPLSIVRQVPIVHPHFHEISDLGMKWYAVPIISDMCLEIGGIRYSCVPFNGWYMGTEIGARNLADTFRYNMLPKVAKAIGLSTTTERTLWRDRALVELNVAVLYSYKREGVSIVDHHTAAEQFHLFEQQEQRCKRHVTGNWSWLIPPLSPATTHLFHRPYDNTIVKPNFFYRSP